MHRQGERGSGAKRKKEPTAPPQRRSSADRTINETLETRANAALDTATGVVDAMRTMVKNDNDDMDGDSSPSVSTCWVTCTKG